MCHTHYTQTSAPRVYKSSRCSSYAGGETDDIYAETHAKLGTCLSRSDLLADHPQLLRRTRDSQGRLGLRSLVPLAFPDCHEFFEAVVDDPQGGRIWKGTFQAAHEFRHRSHQFRRLHRKNNEKIYKPGELMFGCSEYDTLKLQLKEDSAGDW